jgi:undecaprenyl-diphosphatase
MYEALVEFEIGILDGIQNLIGCKFCDGLFTFITHLGDGGILWIVIAVALLFFKKTRRIGVNMGLALILGLIFGNLIMKNLFQRARPYTHEDIAMIKESMLLISKPSDFSFPSGHTLGSFNGAISIFLYNKKWGTAALVLATLIAFSRMYVYVHFPTDIIGGILLATGCAILSYYILKRFVPQRYLAKP